MRFLFLIGAALVGILSSSARAQQPNDDPAIQNWLALPMKPELMQSCSTTLRNSLTIANLKSRGATLSQLLRWAEQEAERTAAEVPSDQLLPIGTMLVLTKLIQASYLAAPIYQEIGLPFSQFAYRSCLKGQPVDQ